MMKDNIMAKCLIKNISEIGIMVNFQDNTKQFLLPKEIVVYDDSERHTTKETWNLVEMGLLQDEDLDFWNCLLIKSGYDKLQSNISDN